MKKIIFLLSCFNFIICGLSYNCSYLEDTVLPNSTVFFDECSEIIKELDNFTLHNVTINCPDSNKQTFYINLLKNTTTIRVSDSYLNCSFTNFQASTVIIDGTFI